MQRRWLVLLYAAAFVLLALADLGSTLLGHRIGAREFNPAMAAGDRIDVLRFLLVNALLGVMLIGMVNWALARSDRAEPAYMARPWRAALSWMTYLNPFATRNQPRAIFHWTAMAISLLLVRAVVVANNLAIGAQLPDLLTPLARIVAIYATGTLQYLIAVTILITPFWLLSLYVTRSLLLAQSTHGSSDRRPLREKAA